jgi:hypothetical protein
LDFSAGKILVIDKIDELGIEILKGYIGKDNLREEICL